MKVKANHKVEKKVDAPPSKMKRLWSALAQVAEVIVGWLKILLDLFAPIEL
jgi:hypothetical protein